MTGTLPTAILEFPSLQQLYLYDNSFTGTIPDAFFNTRNLVDLHLRSNFLSGTIPKSLFDIENNRNDAMVNLNLGRNLLTGTIPTEIGVLTSLKGLFLDNNHFTGTIPTEIGQLEVLCESQIGRGEEGGAGLCGLYCHAFHRRLQVVGTIQSIVWVASSHSVREPFFSSTSLRICTRLYLTVCVSLSPSVHIYMHVCIAAHAFIQTSTAHTRINHNQLNGTIPTEIGQMSSLESFFVQENALIGSIPAEFGDLLFFSTFCFWWFMYAERADKEKGRTLPFVPLPSVLNLVTSRMLRFFFLDVTRPHQLTHLQTSTSCFFLSFPFGPFLFIPQESSCCIPMI